MDNEKLSFTSIVPEFFVDMICRVLPGSTLVVFYAWDNIPANPSFELGIGVIFIGYIVGFTAGTFGEYVLEWIIKSIPWLAKDYTFNSEIIAEIDKLSEASQAVMKKMLAEATLFKTLATLCIPLIAIKAPVFNRLTLYSNWHVLLAAWVFLTCHFIRNKKFSERLKNIR